MDKARANQVLDRTDEILRWEQPVDQQKDQKLAKYVCEVRNERYWRQGKRLACSYASLHAEIRAESKPHPTLVRHRSAAAETARPLKLSIRVADLGPTARPISVKLQHSRFCSTPS
jgi:hypothetical protein